MNSEFHSQELDKVAAALAKAQGAMKPAAKDAQNPHLRSTYASLASVREAIREPFAENGLSISQLLFGDTLVTLLMHESGQWLKSEIPIEAPEAKGISNLQSLGSALTYLRRYALSAIAGVSVSDEDDDGQSSPDVKIKQQPRQSTNGKPKKPEAKKPGEPERPYTPEQFKAKIASVVAYCHENRATLKTPYHDPETGEAFPIKMHSNKKAAQILAAQWQKALKDAEGIDDPEVAYHDSLAWLFDGVTSANDLDAVHAMALFKLMFNGSEPSFEAEVIDNARSELVSIAQAAITVKGEIPF